MQSFIRALIVGNVVGVVNEFKADHSFMFFIKDNRNRMILFVGLINQL
jgi:serine protease inhibitor